MRPFFLKNRQAWIDKASAELNESTVLSLEHYFSQSPSAHFDILDGAFARQFLGSRLKADATLAPMV